MSVLSRKRWTLSVPRTRLSVRDGRSVSSPSATPWPRAKSKNALMFGGAEVELEESISPSNPVDYVVVFFSRIWARWLGSSGTGTTWQPGMGFGNRENVMHLSLDRGKENGETKKFINPKQWHGALCDTKLCGIFYFLLFDIFAFLFFQTPSNKTSPMMIPLFRPPMSFHSG